MSKLYAKWIEKDTNSLETATNALRVKVDAAGAIERTSSGLNIKAVSITNAMLAGSIAFDKLSDSANIARLDQAETVAAIWDFGTFLPTAGANPSSDNQLARKAYVDSVAQGLDAKDSVKAGTTANITLANEQTIDGIALVAGDRVLVKNQTASEENGIYTVVDLGTWTRTDDANTWDELISAFCFVEEGTVNADNGYVCTVNSGGTLETTSVTWVQFSGAGQITAGTGLSKTGNTLNVGDANKGVQVNADDLEIDASEIAGNGLKAGASSHLLAVEPNDIAGNGLEDDGSDNLQVVPDTTSITTTEANAVIVGANGVSVKVDDSTIEGSGQGGAGAESLRVKAQGIAASHLGAVTGNGLSGGSGATIAVNPATLIQSGNAEIDGDKIDIDFTPSNYTPSTSPAEVDDVNQLSAHLAGLDNAITGVSSENIKQDMHKITSGEVTQGYFELGSTPLNVQSVRVTVVNGPMQVSKQAVGATGVTPDFDVLNTDQVHINNTGAATGLSEELIADDIVIIEYAV